MQIRTQFPDSQLETQLPALRAVTFTRFNKYPDQFSKVFNVQDSDRAIEQFSGISGFGLFGQVTEGGRITYDTEAQGFDKTFKHTDWALGYRVSHQLQRDDKFRLVANMAKELGRSARITVEVDAASDFNNGFSGSYNGPDGVPLFSASHPRVKAGSTQSNLASPAVDLDVSTLEAALTAFRGFTDDAGKLVMVEPTRLIVPPALEFVAAEILSGKMRSDTANNTINAFTYRDGISNFTKFFTWNYLTDPDAWFVAADPDDLALMFFHREKFDTYNDYDFDTRALKTAGWMAFSHGWYDWMGLYGSAGA
jgi:phage major head subunit gpT-like protein